MHDVFIDALEKQHDLGKRGDTGFKPEACAYYSPLGKVFIDYKLKRTTLT